MNRRRNNGSDLFQERNSKGRLEGLINPNIMPAKQTGQRLFVDRSNSVQVNKQGFPLSTQRLAPTNNNDTGAINFSALTTAKGRNSVGGTVLFP